MAAARKEEFTQAGFENFISEFKKKVLRARKDCISVIVAIDGDSKINIYRVISFENTRLYHSIHSKIYVRPLLDRIRELGIMEISESTLPYQFFEITGFSFYNFTKEEVESI